MCLSERGEVSLLSKTDTQVKCGGIYPTPKIAASYWTKRVSSGKIKQLIQKSASDGPAGLFPPPQLNWANWRSHVRKIKESKGLSINELTGRSGLDRSTIIELLGGRRGVADFRIGTLWALAWALEVDDFTSFLAPLLEADLSKPDSETK